VSKRTPESQCKRLFSYTKIFSNVLVTDFYMYPEHTPTSENNVVVGALTAMSMPTRGTFPAGCASAASGATKRARARVMPSAIIRRSMGTSDVHALSGAFYALHVSEGTQILQVKSFKSVDTIRGHSSIELFSTLASCCT
jgi:hypothetical protein